jgi:hypothetical protein
MLTAIRTGAAIALVAAIGLLDAMVSPRLPFSILYFLPVIAAAWYANRTQGLIVAVAAAAARVATDVRSNGVDPLTVTQAVLWGAALCWRRGSRRGRTGGASTSRPSKAASTSCSRWSAASRAPIR